MKTIKDLMTKTAELQIAPLIDVVFLLLVYFMVTASLVKTEADLSFALPTTGSDLSQPIEVVLQVSEQGDVIIEGMVFSQDRQNELVQQLSNLKASADSSQSEVVVSVLPSDQTRHGSIVRAMDACAAARLDNLSFSMIM